MWLNQSQPCLFSAQNEGSAVCLPVSGQEEGKDWEQDSGDISLLLLPGRADF